MTATDAVALTTGQSVAATSSGAGPVRGTREAPAFRVFLLLTLGLSVPLIVGLVVVLAPLEALDVLLVTLFALNTLWVAAAAATALVGLSAARDARAVPMPAGWRPRDRTAVLFLICGEEAGAVAQRIAALDAELRRTGLDATTDLWLLSDTSAGNAGPEEEAIAHLVHAGTLKYRRRARNARRKPGNLAAWIERHGTDYESMLVMDADSAMTAERLRTLRFEMERNPSLGLLQSGIALRPGNSRLTHLLRLSTRLTGPVFIRGLSRWSGDAGNYWGHNALIRIAAFRGAMCIPALRGPAPYGGEFLSHDFIEAAWLVRAGWQVAIAPEMRGSSEAGPDTISTFHRRDRRWCQGNLQHLRALFAHSLHPVSRIHLACGIQSYLSSPIWLAIVLLFLLAGMAPGAVPILSGALALLLVPKLAAVLGLWQRTRSRWRRRVYLRATGAELVLSTLVSPLVMVRQTLAVLAVLAGRDCGWKRPASPMRRTAPTGTLEACAGASLLTVALLGSDTAYQALWPTLIAGPLLAAPWLMAWLDRSAVP